MKKVDNNDVDELTKEQSKKFKEQDHENKFTKHQHGVEVIGDESIKKQDIDNQGALW